jgi:hypothetical protein
VQRKPIHPYPNPEHPIPNPEPQTPNPEHRIPSMSAERHLNPSEPNPMPAVETIYTTVESQPDQTDWLTVVSNLRQINRQLVEQIARLEQALASAKQSLHTSREEKQTHEITILQQQDELRIAQDRVGALFQQLETSHQIGQRQQNLIETLSQQLEITQAIVPQLEAENNDLRQKYQQQAEKLTKTEQVAVELHRRMKQQAVTPTVKPDPTPSSIETTQPVAGQTEIETADTPASSSNPAAETTPTQTDLVTPGNSDDIVVETPEISPTNPTTAQEDIPAWSPTPPTATRTISPSTQVSWREAIASNISQNNYHLSADRLPDPTPAPLPPADVVNKESTASAKPATNWPAPTLERRAKKDETLDLSANKTAIDLPKFPKKK